MSQIKILTGQNEYHYPSEENTLNVKFIFSTIIDLVTSRLEFGQSFLRNSCSEWGTEKGLACYLAWGSWGTKEAVLNPILAPDPIFQK